MPIKIIVIIIIISLIALAVIGFFSKSFGESGKSIGAEALKSSACLKWCNSNTPASEINVTDTLRASNICEDYGDVSCVDVCNCGRKQD